VADPVDEELGRISQRIRSRREHEGLTLQELGRRSGVATSTIQKVETAQMIPSVAVLMKIARGLRCRMTELVGEETEEEAAIVHLPKKARHAFGKPDAMMVERLTGDLADLELETWRVTIHPGCSSGEERMHYRGEQLVICEEGTVTIAVGDREIRLAAGDSLHFKATAPHAWRNDGRKPTRFLVSGTLPAQLRAAMQARAFEESPRARAR
jgi:transcriptional regulator with XRE-family HTH domain